MRARIVLSFILVVAFRRSIPVYWIAAGYMAATALLLCLPVAVLRQKRIRAATIVMDLVGITFFVHYTGGFGSIWFLLYVFPILSAARYLGSTWTNIVAMAATVAYAIGIGTISANNAEQFAIQAAVFIAIANTAAGLARQRDRAESKLLTGLADIQREILGGASTDSVLDIILDFAMEITGSDASAIVLIDGSKAIAARRAARKKAIDAAAAERLVRRNYERVLASGEFFSIPKAGLRQWLPFPSADPEQWPGLLVPLTDNRQVFGVLGVFSRLRLHYTQDERQKLMRMTPMIAIAQKFARLRGEAKERLDLLYRIGTSLKSDEGLEKLFDKVVDLAATQLGAEEAALFIANDEKTEITKVAVAAMDGATEADLRQVENRYTVAHEVTGCLFETWDGLFQPDWKPEDQINTVAQHLPSKEVRHYMGAPLRLGRESLGAIRVLNKKGPAYSPATPRLDFAGFTPDDFELLRMIATQIASAIRNAIAIERKKDFEDLIENSPDPIIVLDRRGRIKYFNAACVKTWDIEAKDAIGDRVETYYESREHAKAIMEALEQADQNTIHDYDANIRDKYGTIIPIRLSARLLKDGKGNVTGSIGVFKDQRPFLRLQEEKIVAEKLAASRQMTRGRVHDLKHDLGIIKDCADILDNEGDDETIELCNHIRDAADRVVEKLNAEIVVAEPKGPETFEVISLPEFLEEFLYGKKRDTDLWGVRMNATFPEQNLWIRANRDQLALIFSNLLTNSVEAIKERSRTEGHPSSGEVKVKVSIVDSVAQVFWSDDGIGMTRAVRTTLFRPFFTTKKHGSGMGLYYTQQFLELVGGGITVETAGDQGAAFCITLPLTKAEAEEQG